MFARIAKLKHYFFRRHTPTLNWVEIRRDALIHNYQAFCGLVRLTDTIIPVLKSNAYGHGLREVSQIISSIKRVEMIAVDNYPETQQVLHYTDCDVLMMGETHPSRYRSLDCRRVHVAVHTPQIIQALIDTGKEWRVHLFLNTGLNREGVQEADLAHILEMIRGSRLVIEGVMSHFACDDEDDGEQESLDQIILFKRMYAVIESYGHTPLYRHINNTSGMIRFSDPWFNTHRLGKGLYGFVSNKGSELLVQTLDMVADVYSIVTATQQLESGQGVGYGYQWITPTFGQIITIPFGYAEGLTRVMAGQWNVRVHDVELPLVGAISMNYSSARAEDKEEGEQQGIPERVQVLKHGDIVHVISSNPEHTNNRNEVARINYTITRELLIKMDEKIRRVVV